MEAPLSGSLGRRAGVRTALYDPRLKTTLIIAGIAVSLTVGCGSSSRAASSTNTQPQPSHRFVQRLFFTPKPNATSCELDINLPASPKPVTSAYCMNAHRGVTLTPSGHVTVTCKGCIGNAPSIPVRTLHYGQSASLGPFRCTAVRAGARCVVVVLGRGFLIGAHSVKRIY